MLNHLSMCTTYIHVVNVPLSLTYLPLSYNACDTKKTLYREEERTIQNGHESSQRNPFSKSYTPHKSTLNLYKK